MGRALPWSSAALVIGSLAIVGLPPFGLFVSEFLILTEAFTQARYPVAVLLLVALSVVFGALLYHFQRMLAGDPESALASRKLPVADFAVMGVCAACLLVLGLRIPSAFSNALRAAMAVLQ